MSIVKITLLAAATLWTGASAAADLPTEALRIEQRFASDGTQHRDCTGSLRWGEDCHAHNIRAPAFSPAVATLAAARPDALARQAFLEDNRALQARFAKQ